MTAVVRTAWGTIDDVVGVKVGPTPTPGDGQVVLEVAAAGIERGSLHLVSGLPYLMRLMGYGIRRPTQPVLGSEVAGRVVALGPGVTRLSLGDRVFGVASGSFAEYAVADADELAHVPDDVASDAAALAAISGATALEAVEDHGRVRPGHHVLVLGASGGVGSAAVQLAKAAGATVTGVASTAKLDAVRALGADHVVDYTTQDPLDTDVRYDVILDIAGQHPTARLRRVLADDGTLVFVGGEGGQRITGGVGRGVRGMLLSPFVSHRLVMFIGSEDHELLARVATHLANGSLVPVVDRRIGLDDVPAAMHDLEAGRVTGKIAIVIDREI
ncbi:NAD(P)-dependent alcohol dehydrogenase [Nitriliruptoria bacterium AS10]|nr:NAD(P)-dependent alcohol dehydrogenase [Salsipaludibacter albus]